MRQGFVNAASHQKTEHVRIFWENFVIAFSFIFLRFNPALMSIYFKSRRGGGARTEQGRGGARTSQKNLLLLSNPESL